MSDELDLDAIEARANAATPSPWQTDSTECCVLAEDYLAERINHAPDAAFIAAAREDVPNLVAEVRRLQDQIAAWEKWAAKMGYRQFFSDSELVT